MKPFEAPQRIVKVEIWVSFLLIRLYEMPGVGRVKGGMIPICYDLYCNFWEDFVEQFFLHGRPILTRKLWSVKRFLIQIWSCILLYLLLFRLLMIWNFMLKGLKKYSFPLQILHSCSAGCVTALLTSDNFSQQLSQI